MPPTNSSGVKTPPLGSAGSGGGSQGKSAAKLTVTVSANEMEAWAHLEPGPVPTEQELLGILANKGVKYGLLPEAVRRLVRSPNPGKTLVARGIPAKPNESGRIEYFFVAPEENLSFTPAAGEDRQQVDFREGKLIELVESGAVLARKRGGKKGIAGRSVSGKEIQSPTAPEPVLIPGKGTRIDAVKQAVVATTGGVPTVLDGRVEVHPVLQLPEVDMASGNIFYLGSVRILGEVAPGFVVAATGNIEVEGTVEGAVLLAGGNVLVKAGVRNHARIDAAGDITVRFVDSNSELKAERDIQILGYCVRSALWAGGRIRVKGKIVSGTTKAGIEVDAGELGAHGEAQTVIDVGPPDFTDERHERLLRDLKAWEANLSILSAKSHALEAAGHKGPIAAAELKRATAAQVRASIGIQQLKGQIAAVEAILDRTVENAGVHAGTAHPGTSASICGQTYVLSTVERGWKRIREVLLPEPKEETSPPLPRLEDDTTGVPVVSKDTGRQLVPKTVAFRPAAGAVITRGKVLPLAVPRLDASAVSPAKRTPQR